ncbi:MAG: 3-isopropylmalate dehydratase small subunit [Helicobacteraceae bacterium]|jgi:3-isopropylmalate/(R)-2-methylmalate dehydratase small subunit|nr:3-isopropylmalate dehydratase small subunit [Helicobacteraceae bacterium]
MIQGKVWRFGDNIDTDLIIAARYLSSGDPNELKKHIFEDADPNFISKAQKGDIIVAGSNFGCGSSREHAPVAIRAFGIAAVIAESFARIFYRNAFNTGLLIYECADTGRIGEGDLIEIDEESGVIVNSAKKEEYRFKTIPPFMRELLAAGGLMEYAKKEMRL